VGLGEGGNACIAGGFAGSVRGGPAANIEGAYAEGVGVRRRRQAQYATLRDKPCVTKSGEPVTLMLNAGLLIDLPHIAETGAAGIGLFPPELPILVAGPFPRPAGELSMVPAVSGAAAGR